MAVVTLGERRASWAELSDAVATGAVEEVRVVGALPAGSTGDALVEVHWRSDLWRHVTEVAQVRGAGGPSKPSLTSAEGVSQVLRADPGVQLTHLRPGLDVARDASRPPRSTLAGWEAPGWLGIAAFGATVVGFAVLVAGPEPWRATRWAWFWLLWIPLAGVAFALLSGPFPRVRDPRVPARRLRGGWALVTTLVVTSLLRS